MATFWDILTELQVVADDVWFSQNGWYTLLDLLLYPELLTSNSETTELLNLYFCTVVSATGICPVIASSWYVLMQFVFYRSVSW